MPELFRFFGIRLYFYSHKHLPIHAVELVENNGMKNKDLKIAEGLIEENKEVIERRWKEYFKP